MEKGNPINWYERPDSIKTGPGILEQMAIHSNRSLAERKKTAIKNIRKIFNCSKIKAKEFYKVIS